MIRSVIWRLEGGDFYSLTLRRIFREFYDVEIGMYSHGGCFEPEAMDRRTMVGRYCSIAQGVKILNINHPMDFKSTHAFFFNPLLRHCPRDLMRYQPLEIGHDVWIGANAIILPRVKTIGTGAVIGAASVVSKDVPPYAVVVGNPARVVRFRFPQETVDKLLESHWWEKPIDELDIPQFCQPLMQMN